MENSCNQFLEDYKLPAVSNGMEIEIRPVNLIDIDENNKNLLISEIKKVPKDNLLFLILGFDLIFNKNIDKVEKILHDYENCVYILGIEPDFNRIYTNPGVEKGADIIKDAEKCVFGYFVDRFNDKIKGKTLIQAPFPLTVFYPEPHKSMPTRFIRESTLYPNSLEVLK